MATEIDQLLRTLRPDKLTEGITTLVSLTSADLEVDRQSKNIQSDMLFELVEHHNEVVQTFQKVDFGIGKVLKVIEASYAMKEVSTKPTREQMASQDMLEWLNLIDTRIEESNNYEKGILFNVTRIHSIIESMEDRMQKMEDKKTFVKPAQKPDEDKPTAAQPYSWGEFFGALGAGLKWIVAPIAAFVWGWMKKAWAGARTKISGWVDNIFGGIKKSIDNIIATARNWIDNVISGLAKRFPKTANMVKTIGSFFGKLLAKPMTLFKKIAPVLAHHIGGVFGLLMAPLAKLAGKLILPLVIAYDFFTGWFNADNITGKAKEGITLFDKVVAGAMSILSGFTLGFVSAQDFYQVIFGDYGIIDTVKSFFTDLWNNVLPTELKGLLENIGSIFSALWTEAEIFLNSFGINKWNIGKTIEKLMDDIATWVDEKITFKNLMPAFLGGESEQDTIDNKNAAFTKVNNARTMPMMLDTSSAALSAKKAKMEAEKKAAPMIFNTPPATVVTTGGAAVPNVFEPDMFMQLIGR